MFVKIQKKMGGGEGSCGGMGGGCERRIEVFVNKKNVGVSGWGGSIGCE